MAIAARIGSPVIEAEAPLARDVLRAPAAPQSGLEPESISDLAVQWRNAYDIAEAQERRLAAVEEAALKLYAGEEGEALLGEIWQGEPGWFRQTEAIDASLGVPALEETAKCAWRVVDRLAERLLELRPANVQEAALKFGVLMTIVRGDHQGAEEPDRLQDFLEDLTRLAGN